MKRLLPWILAIAAIAVAALALRPDQQAAVAPPVPQHEPAPGDPPVVWVTGSLAEIDEDRLVVEQGAGPSLEVRRLAGGATTFHRPGDGAWIELSFEQAQRVEPGPVVCIETLIDGDLFIAIRVYIEARGCGPL